jgi:hypothetical protein
MMYPHGFVLQMPYIDTLEDGSTTQNYAVISTNTPVNHRRVKRVIRQAVKLHLGRNVHPVDLHALLKCVRKHSEPMQYFVHRQVTREAA